MLAHFPVPEHRCGCLFCVFVETTILYRNTASCLDCEWGFFVSKLRGQTVMSKGPTHLELEVKGMFLTLTSCI